MSTSPLASRAVRQCFQLLEDHFDEADGRYRDGYSDERISKETTLSITAVHDHRVAAFGKIKPPSELKELRRELEELQRLYLTMDQDFKAKLEELKRKIKAVGDKYD